MTSYYDGDTTDLRRSGGTLTTEAAATDGDRPGERTVLLPRISTDPVDDLVERVRPQLGRAVDALQVAAFLEAAGHTDRGAQVEYGYADDFVLAAEVFRRMGPPSPVDEGTRVPPPDSDGWSVALRPVSHGLLYALPSASFPAVLVIVGRPGLVLGLVCAGTLGWIYSGVVAYSAYRRLRLGRPRSAGRILRTATLTGPLLGVVASAALVAHGGLALAVLMVLQLTYQMASTLLIFYRREAWLAVAMVPAAQTGTA